MNKRSIALLLAISLTTALGFTGCEEEKNNGSAQKTEPISLLVFDDVSDSTSLSEAMSHEAGQAKLKFIASVRGTIFSKITLIRVGRGNMNSSRNHFPFRLPAPPERPEPDYESLGPVGKTNNELRRQKEDEAEEKYKDMMKAFEAEYQAAFKLFEERFFYSSDALEWPADDCVKAESLREKLAQEIESANQNALCVIFSDGQFCEAITGTQPLNVRTAIILYPDESADKEKVYRARLESLFPQAHILSAVQADRALSLLNGEFARQ